MDDGIQQRFYVAVEGLATGDQPLAERLRNTFPTLLPLVDDPEMRKHPEINDRLTNVIHLLQEEGMTDPLQPAPGRMSNDVARATAAEIFDLMRACIECDEDEDSAAAQSEPSA
jgi:hypothetical protein